MNTQPPGWPVSAPNYFSVDGYLYEKKLAYNKVAFHIKDNKACQMITKAAEISELAYIAFDVELGYRMEAIVVRLAEYRTNLLTRYNPTNVYGTV